MAGRYTGSYLDQSNGWRAVATLADMAELHSSDASPNKQLGLCQGDDNKTECSSITGEATSHSCRELDQLVLEASQLGGCLPHDMYRHPSGDDGELLGEADEIDDRAIRLVPLRSPTWSPALLAGGLVGNGESGGEQILIRLTHNGVIAEKDAHGKGRPQWRAPFTSLQAMDCLHLFL
jgi:hypothetical protein